MQPEYDGDDAKLPIERVSAARLPPPAPAENQTQKYAHWTLAGKDTSYGLNPTSPYCGIDFVHATPWPEPLPSFMDETNHFSG